MTDLFITRAEYNTLISEKSSGEFATLNIDSDLWDLNTKQWVSGPPAVFTISSARCETIEEARAQFESWLPANAPSGEYTALYIGKVRKEYSDDEASPLAHQVWHDLCFLRGKWCMQGGKLEKVCQ